MTTWVTQRITSTVVDGMRWSRLAAEANTLSQRTRARCGRWREGRGGEEEKGGLLDACFTRKAPPATMYSKAVVQNILRLRCGCFLSGEVVPEKCLLVAVLSLCSDCIRQVSRTSWTQSISSSRMGDHRKATSTGRKSFWEWWIVSCKEIGIYIYIYIYILWILHDVCK